MQQPEKSQNELRRWFKDILPGLNLDVDLGHVSLEDFVLVVRQIVVELREQTRGYHPMDELGVREARRQLQLLGFIMSSCEKHFQDHGHRSGEGIKQLVYAEELCTKLALIAGHPPRDSAYTYWIWNSPEEALTFTGNPQEMLFHRTINRSDDLFNRCCRILRQICSGDVSLSSDTARDLLNHATDHLLEAKTLFLSLMTYTDESRSTRRLEPAFFMRELRTYLIPYPIHGKTWAGVSAANLASPMQLDYLIGTVNDTYVSHTTNRFEYLPMEYVNELKTDMTNPSLLDLILHELNLTKVEVMRLDCNSLRSRLRQNSDLIDVLNAFKSLIDATATLTASHWALINNYLIKPSARLSLDERKQLTVDPSVGTSGMTMEEVKDTRDMRRQHPLVMRVMECIS